jgi:hypothetical protein
MSLRLISLSLTLVACSAGSTTHDAPPPAPHDDAGGANASVNAADICQAIVADVASCSTVTESACESVIDTASKRGCAQWLPALASWCTTSDHAYACTSMPVAGTYGQISADAPVDAVIADACTGAVNKTECWSIDCANSTDCPTGYTCNDATAHCVSWDGKCFGLPCASFTDCPTGETCSTEIGVCIKQ